MTVTLQGPAFILRTLILALVFALAGYYGLTLWTAPETTGFALPLALLLAGSVIFTSLYHWLLFRLGQRSTTLYVGNLAFKTTESELFELFSKFGPLRSVRIMKDRITRRPRGYAFVELGVSAAKSAARELNGNEFGGRTLKVNIANKRSRSQD